MKDLNWSDIRVEYVTTRTSYRQLAKKYDVSESALNERAIKEGWFQQKKEYQSKTATKTIEKIASNESNRIARSMQASDELTEEIFAAINKAKEEGITLPARDIKAYASALRDLKDLCGWKTEEKANEAISITITNLPEDWKE